MPRRSKKTNKHYAGIMMRRPLAGSDNKWERQPVTDPNLIEKYEEAGWEVDPAAEVMITDGSNSGNVRVMKFDEANSLLSGTASDDWGIAGHADYADEVESKARRDRTAGAGQAALTILEQGLEGLTVGGFSAMLKAAGDDKGFRERAMERPTLATASQIGGMLIGPGKFRSAGKAGYLIPTLAAERGGVAAGKLGQALFKRAAAKKIAGKATELAVEGALVGAPLAVSEAYGNDELSSLDDFFGAATSGAGSMAVDNVIYGGAAHLALAGAAGAGKRWKRISETKQAEYEGLRNLKTGLDESNAAIHEVRGASATYGLALDDIAMQAGPKEAVKIEKLRDEVAELAGGWLRTSEHIDPRLFKRMAKEGKLGKFVNKVSKLEEYIAEAGYPGIKRLTPMTDISDSIRYLSDDIEVPVSGGIADVAFRQHLVPLGKKGLKRAKKNGALFTLRKGVQSGAAWQAFSWVRQVPGLGIAGGIVGGIAGRVTGAIVGKAVGAKGAEKVIEGMKPSLLTKARGHAGGALEHLGKNWKPTHSMAVTIAMTSDEFDKGYAPEFNSMQDAFPSYYRAIRSAVQDPTRAENRLFRAFSSIGITNPRALDHMVATAMSQMKYMWNNIPHGDNISGTSPALTMSDEIRLTEDLETLRDPGSIIDTAAAGNASQRSIKLVSNVYPELYQKMIEELQQQLVGRSNIEALRLRRTFFGDKKYDMTLIGTQSIFNQEQQQPPPRTEKLTTSPEFTQAQQKQQ